MKGVKDQYNETYVSGPPGNTEQLSWITSQKDARPWEPGLPGWWGLMGHGKIKGVVSSGTKRKPKYYWVQAHSACCMTGQYIERQGAKNSDFIGKASKARRWWTSVPKNHLTCVRIQELFFFFPFIFISWRLITLQYCSGFCHTLTWISHGFTCVPHLDPPPASLSTPSLWVFQVHQPWALVSCIQPGLVICLTLDSILVSMLFSLNIPPLPSSRV